MVFLLVLLLTAIVVGSVFVCIYSFYAYDMGDTDNLCGKYENAFTTPFNQLYDYGQGKAGRGQKLKARNLIRSEQNALKREIRAERKTNKGVKSDG